MLLKLTHSSCIKYIIILASKGILIIKHGKKTGTLTNKQTNKHGIQQNNPTIKTQFQIPLMASFSLYVHIHKDNFMYCENFRKMSSLVYLAV